MRFRVFALYVCFFLSGASALVYQVVWERMLTLVFGLSTLSVAAVLSAFLGGMALGARIFGPIADRSPRPFPRTRSSRSISGGSDTIATTVNTTSTAARVRTDSLTRC